MISLTCQCCGQDRAFNSAEQAYEEGWDAPPHFTIIACDLCPASLIALEQKHKHTPAHERWAKDGRPKSWNESVASGDIPPLPGDIPIPLDMEEINDIISKLE